MGAVCCAEDHGADAKSLREPLKSGDQATYDAASASASSISIPTTPHARASIGVSGSVSDMPVSPGSIKERREKRLSDDLAATQIAAQQGRRASIMVPAAAEAAVADAVAAANSPLLQPAAAGASPPPAADRLSAAAQSSGDLLLQRQTTLNVDVVDVDAFVSSIQNPFASGLAPTLCIKLTEYGLGVFTSNEHYLAFLHENQVHLLPPQTPLELAATIVFNPTGATPTNGAVMPQQSAGPMREPDFLFSRLALKRTDGNKVVFTEIPSGESRKFLAENFVEARRLTRYVEQFAEFLKMRGTAGGKA